MGLLGISIPTIRIFSDPSPSPDEKSAPSPSTVTESGTDTHLQKPPSRNSHASSSSRPPSSYKSVGEDTSNASSPVAPAPDDDAASRQRSIDPLSSMILKRVGTEGQHSVSSGGTAVSPLPPPASHSDTATQANYRQHYVGTDPELGRASTSSNTGTTSFETKRQSKSLKPPGGGGTLFSKLRKSSGRPTREDESDNHVDDKREEGFSANVFGYVPDFPIPPKYIHVRAHRKQKREMNRVFLAQQLNPDLPGAIWCAKFSQDGRYFATAGEDKVVRVWQVISFPDERDGGTSDGEDSSSSSSEDDLESSSTMDAQDGHHGRHIKRHFHRRRYKMRVYAPVFRPKPVREYFGHSSDVLDISWSKNNFLLSSSMDKTVRLWHIDRPDCLCTFLHSDFVTSIRFHPKDDRFFLSGSLDCKLRLWSIPDKEVAYSKDVPDLITAVAFSPEGVMAIAGCFGGQCLFYETDGLHLQTQIHVRSSRGRNSKGSKITGIEAFVLPKEIRNKGGLGSSFDDDIKLLISTNDSRIRLYNLYDKTIEVKFKGHENEQSQINASFSDDGMYIVSGSEDERTYIWKTVPEKPDGYSKKKDVQEYEYFHSNKSMVTTALFAPKLTKCILAATEDPVYDLCDPPPVKLQPTNTGEGVESSTSTPTSEEPSTSQPPDNHTSIVSGRTFPPLRAETRKSSHPDGNIIVTTDSDGVIKIFRQDCAYEPRKQLLESTSMQKKRISGIAISPTPSWRESLSVHRTRSSRGSARASSPFQFPRIMSSERLPTVASPLSQPDRSERGRQRVPSQTSSPVRSSSPLSRTALRSREPQRTTSPLSVTSKTKVKPNVLRMSSTESVPHSDITDLASAHNNLDLRQHHVGDDVACDECGGTEFRAKRIQGRTRLACAGCQRTLPE